MSATTVSMATSARIAPTRIENLGTLTDFAQPDDCASLTLSLSRNATAYFDWGRRCYGPSTIGLKPTCLPSSYEQMLRSKSYPAYSPASVCPKGYVSQCGFEGMTASHRAYDLFASLMSQILEPTQTAVGCCQSGYQCLSNVPYSCVSVVPTGIFITADANTICTAPTPRMVAYGAKDSDASLLIHAPIIMLVGNKPEATTPTMTSSATTSVPPPPSNTTAAADSNSKDTGGLSTAAIAAIGVCIPLAALCASLALFLFMRRRSRRAKTADAGNAPTAKEDYAGGQVEMDSSSPQLSTLAGSPSSGFGFVPSDRAATVSLGSASTNRASELYGSTIPARLHEHIVELPVEINEHGAENPGPQMSPPSN